MPDFDALFFEPFYQMLRQQLLAHEMERAHELGAGMVSLLHIAPEANRDCRRVTSPQLAALGDTPTSVWNSLIRPGDRFLSVSTETLFGTLSANHMPKMQEWLTYVQQRYAWIR